MKDMRRKVLVLAGGVIIVAGLVAGSGVADSTRPPKAATDQIRRSLLSPSADTSDIGGIVDPSKSQGAMIIQRDPATGNVVRDPKTGLPRVLTDAHGNPALFKPGEVPPDQVQAQDKLNQLVQRAQNGDQSALKTLKDEADRTSRAVEAHPNGS